MKRPGVNDCYMKIVPLRLVYHGEWEDPEIAYNGRLVNYYEFDTAARDMYFDDMWTENTIDFPAWCKQNAARLKALFMDLVTGGEM